VPKSIQWARESACSLAGRIEELLVITFVLAKQASTAACVAIIIASGKDTNTGATALELVLAFAKQTKATRLMPVIASRLEEVLAATKTSVELPQLGHVGASRGLSSGVVDLDSTGIVLTATVVARHRLTLTVMGRVLTHVRV